MHSTLLTDLLLETLSENLGDCDQGLIAISLPMPYASVSSMLTILGEGRNLDYLGEAAQLLGNKMPTSNSFATPSMISKEERTHKILSKAEIIVMDSFQDSQSRFETSMVQKPPLEVSSTKDMFEISAISEESEFFDNVIGTSFENITLGTIENKNIVTATDSVVKPEVSRSKPDDDEILNNLGNSFMKTILDSKKIEGTCPYSGSIAPGVFFPGHDSMMTSLDEWSVANFSPLTMLNSGGVKNHFNYIFICPHARPRRRVQGGAGIRRRTTTYEYVDCPFRIGLKVKPDGRYIVTRAETEHSGHEVSEEQFEKYRKTRRLTCEQEDAVLALLTQGGKLPEIAKMLLLLLLLLIVIFVIIFIVIFCIICIVIFIVNVKYLYCTGKLPEIAKMLTDFTGRNFRRDDVHNLVRKLQKKFLVIDALTGEEQIEFRGVQVLVLLLLLLLLFLLLLLRWPPRDWG